MQARTNEDIIRIVKKWQSAGFVHELTCRLDNDHAPLVPIERDGKVILGCPTCGTAQSDIPDFVLDSKALLEILQRAYALALEDSRKKRRADFINTLLVCCGGLAFFGSFIHPYYGVSIGLLLGILIAWNTHRERP